jgi:hypothetical protein
MKWCWHPFAFSKILFCKGDCAFVNRSNKLFCCVIRGIHRVVDNYSRLGRDAILLGNLLLAFRWSLLSSVFRKSILLGIIGYSFPIVCMYPAVPSNLLLLDCSEERGRALVRNSFSKLPVNTALFPRGL